MKALQKLSKWLSDYTSIVVIAIAVVTFIVPEMMGWVNHQLFTDPVSISLQVSRSSSVLLCSVWV